MTALDIFFTISSIVFTGLTVYGAITLKRSLLLYGICLYSILPILGESKSFLENGELVHLTIIMAFIAQLIIAFPTKPNYGPDNLAATSLAKKIGLAILITNLVQGYIIVGMSLGVPTRYGYCHLIIAAAMLFVIVRSFNKPEMKWN